MSGSWGHITGGSIVLRKVLGAPAGDAVLFKSSPTWAACACRVPVRSTCFPQVISRRLRLEGNFDFRHVAKRTPGFVGADLAALTKEAAAVAVTRIFSQLDAAVAEAEGRNSAAATQLGLGLGRSSGAEGGTAAGAVQQDSHAVSVSDATGMQVDAVAPANVQQDGTGAPAAGVEGTAGQDAPAVDRLAGGGVEAVVTQRLGCGPLTAAELGGLAITMADFEAALPKVGR